MNTKCITYLLNFISNIITNFPFNFVKIDVCFQDKAIILIFQVDEDFELTKDDLIRLIKTLKHYYYKIEMNNKLTLEVYLNVT